MNCCCGLGQPTISDYTVAGTVVAWGGHIRDVVNSGRWDERIEGAVKTILWNTGGFSWVDAGQISGFLNPYVSIKVTLKNDFAHLGDVFDVIQGAIWQAGFKPESKAFGIESIPQSAETRAARNEIAKPGIADSNPQSDWQWPDVSWPDVSWPDVPDVFGAPSPNNENFSDKLARWFGVTPSHALLIGAGAAVVGVIAIKRIL